MASVAYVSRTERIGKAWLGTWLSSSWSSTSGATSMLLHFKNKICVLTFIYISTNLSRTSGNGFPKKARVSHNSFFSNATWSLESSDEKHLVL